VIGIVLHSFVDFNLQIPIQQHEMDQQMPVCCQSRSRRITIEPGSGRR
jgi:hypothetical protein